MTTDSITERAKSLFCDALDREPEARTTLLTERCGEDEALRERVEGLLEAHERSEQVFGDPVSPWGPCGARLVTPAEPLHEDALGQTAETARPADPGTAFAAAALAARRAAQGRG